MGGLASTRGSNADELFPRGQVVAAVGDRCLPRVAFREVAMRNLKMGCFLRDITKDFRRICHEKKIRWVRLCEESDNFCNLDIRDKRNRFRI
jgi:hypothetical protein